MAIPNQTPYNIFTANGISTVFPYEFYLLNAFDLTVSINGVELTSGFTISGIGNVDGGEVTFLTPPANGSVILLERVVPTYRLTEYQDNGDLLAETVNKDFDRLWMAIQQAFVYLGLALTRPLLGGPFNAKGYRIENLGNPINSQDATPKSYVDEKSAASVQNTLRVPDAYLQPLPSIAKMEGKIVAFSGGRPIGVLPESGSAADVMIILASPEGGDYVNVTPTGLTAPRILSDYFAERVDLRNVAGFVGDGRDESDLFEWAAQKAHATKVPLIVPEGFNVGIGSGTIIPVGTSIHVNGQLTARADSAFYFNDPYFFETNITSSSLKGETQVTVEDISGFHVGQVVSLKYYYPTDDATYNAIAQDPTIMGYQRQLLTVKRFDGNAVVFGSRLLFNITPQSTLSTVTDTDTLIQMNGMGSILATGSGYMIDSNVSRLAMRGGLIDFGGVSKGIKFNSSAFNQFTNSTLRNSVGGNTLFLAYGCNSNFIGRNKFILQADGDSQLCVYAGGYGNVSAFNTYLNGDNNRNRGSVMFGAKAWENRSIGDVIIGGFYGISSFFGAQRNTYADTVVSDQTRASVFLEDSQMNTLRGVGVQFMFTSESDDPTRAGVILKACDGTSIEGGSVLTNGARAISLYDDGGVEVARKGFKIKGTKVIGGDVTINHAVTNYDIDIEIENGRFYNYYVYDVHSNGNIKLNINNGSATLSSFSYGKVTAKIDCSGNYPFGLQIRGFSVYSKVYESCVSNATSEAYLMTGPLPENSIALDPMDNMSINCPTFVTNGISATVTPVPSILPPPGFYLPANVFDRTLARPRAGYRAKGNSDTTYRQWLIVNVSETVQS